MHMCNMNKYSGMPCQAREDDAATANSCAVSKWSGVPCQAKEEDVASVHRCSMSKQSRPCQRTGVNGVVHRLRLQQHLDVGAYTRPLSGSTSALSVG